MKNHVLILCLLGNPYHKTEGGFHKTVYEIIEYFKEKDILITIITSNTTLTEDRFQQIYQNINFEELALDSKWIENQDHLYINADFLTKKIRHIIAKSKVEISLIHSLQWINGYLATQINTKREIIHIHSIISSSFDRENKGFSSRSQYQFQCEEVAFNDANLLISITEAEKKQLIDYYHIPSSKILIMGRSTDFYYDYFYNIYNSQISKEDKLKYNMILENDYMPESQKPFIYVGRIIEYKGIQEIIKAWHILYTKYKDEMPPLWIIGGTKKSIYEFRDVLIGKIPFLIECEKKHKIYWWGYMESYGISTILQKSHALLMHSAFEPGGRVLLESMSAGKPIISTPEGFAQTYIKDWYNGFQVKYKDIDCLAFYMELFIKNNFLSSMLGINAKSTYTILNNVWGYYEKLNKLYRLDKDTFIDNPSFSPELESLHPFLIDQFPYCDIKNDSADLSYLCNNTDIIIEEITKYKSYIWRISLGDEIFFAKQVYNQINLQQIWNDFDSQKVHTIWMQYNTIILSTKYSCIISPYRISEKLFTYLIPHYELVSNKQVYEIYPVLLSKLKKYEHGISRADVPYNEQIYYFKKQNQDIQHKHKFYTINTYTYELQEILSKNQFLFNTNERSTLTNYFQIIYQYLSSRKYIEYGLNYGKSFLMHVVCQNKGGYFLLPSSDIYIGELGQDEGILFVSYFLKYQTLLQTSYYSRKTVLFWSLLHCIKIFISSKILRKPCTVSISDLDKIYDSINNEK